MPLVIKLLNVQHRIIHIMPNALVIVSNVVMIRITVNGNITRHRLLVIFQADCLKQLIGNQAPFQFLHHRFAVGMTFQPRLIIVDVTIHITLRLSCIVYGQCKGLT